MNHNPHTTDITQKIKQFRMLSVCQLCLTDCKGDDGYSDLERVHIYPCTHISHIPRWNGEVQVCAECKTVLEMYLRAVELTGILYQPLLTAQEKKNAI